MKLIDKKKSSRPAATGTTAKECENEKDSHNDSTITKKELQVLFFGFVIELCLALTVWVVHDVVTVLSQTFEPIEHKVTYGETLWTIAKQYKPDSVSMDKYMAWVYEHNDAGLIYPGDVVIMAEVVK